jgi:membrane protease YdiL (CAAX protease family)
MLQAQLVNQTYFKWPEPFSVEAGIKLEKFQVYKVVAVAIASILFFSLQMGCSYPIVAGAALLGSTVTLVSEKFLRTNDRENIDWFNCDFNRSRIMTNIAIRLLVLPVAVCIITLSGSAPLQAVALEIMAGNLRMIFLATVAAPLAEEILFRGFFQEQLEVVVKLFDRYIYPLSISVQQNLKMGLQSVFFGAIHITGNQVATLSRKIGVFCGTTFLGLYLTFLKNKDKSLLSPIAVHSAQNTGFSLGLLASRYFAYTQVN